VRRAHVVIAGCLRNPAFAQQFVNESSGFFFEEIGGRDAPPLSLHSQKILRKFVYCTTRCCGGCKHLSCITVCLRARRQTQPCPDGLRHLLIEPAPPRMAGRCQTKPLNLNFASSDYPCFLGGGSTKDARTWASFLEVSVRCSPRSTTAMYRWCWAWAMSEMPKQEVKASRSTVGRGKRQTG